MDQLLERASNLRYNNSVITREINQMLRNIEEEEMERRWKGSIRSRYY